MDEIPLMKDTDDRQEEEKEDEKEEEEDSTFPEQPNGASTPVRGQTIRNLPTERGGYTTAQTSFIEDLPDIPPGFLSTTYTAEGRLDKEFPFANKLKLKYKIDTNNDMLQVGLLKKIEKTGKPKPYYYLLTKTKIDEKFHYEINKNLPKEVLEELGKSRRQTIREKIETLTEGINENKKVADDEKQNQIERNKARERAKIQIAERTNLAKELKLLTSADYDTTPWENIELQEFQQHQEERRERQKEIQQERKEQQEIAKDENEVPAVRQRAREKINELEIEDNQIENENERELERLPFSERAKVRLKNAGEKIKEFFKKNGVTIVTIAFAAGMTIWAVNSILTDALKSMGKALGNGLKAIAKKTASLLPGLIGSIVSFLFKAAGHAIGFLAEHTRLLILAVVAFLVESYVKKQR